jgi:hypothetical protein
MIIYEIKRMIGNKLRSLFLEETTYGVGISPEVAVHVQRTTAEEQIVRTRTNELLQ